MMIYILDDIYITYTRMYMMIYIVVYVMMIYINDDIHY